MLKLFKKKRTPVKPVNQQTEESKFKHIDLDNAGERLVPGISHNREEIVRHKSTYALYKKIIIQDILNNPEMLKEEISILDLGCGCGHGAYMLSEIPNSKVTAIDVSPLAIEYAQEYYSNLNINYECSKIEDFVRKELVFDYVVSRGVLEHVEAGVNIALTLNWKNRLMVSVPYKEPAGNEHHIHLEMDENIFSNYENPEFIYESIDGFSDINLQEKTNLFTGISSRQGLRIADLLEFPLLPYEFKGLEKFYLENYFRPGY